jgi:hypothetical protein
MITIGSMFNFLSRCFTKTVLLRSFYISLAVGTLLLAVNYGTAILDGNFEKNMLFPVFLNYLIPFSVSKVVAGFQIKDNNNGH